MNNMSVNVTISDDSDGDVTISDGASSVMLNKYSAQLVFLWLHKKFLPEESQPVLLFLADEDVNEQA